MVQLPCKCSCCMRLNAFFFFTFYLIYPILKALMYYSKLFMLTSFPCLDPVQSLLSSTSTNQIISRHLLLFWKFKCRKVNSSSFEHQKTVSLSIQLPRPEIGEDLGLSYINIQLAAKFSWFCLLNLHSIPHFSLSLNYCHHTSSGLLQPSINFSVFFILFLPVCSLSCF